jgi:protochlorophyllide reductase
MLTLASVFSSSLIVQPLAPSRPARSFARNPPLVTASILEKTRSGTLTEIQPGARYRADDQPTKYYSGPNPANKAALQKMRKDIGKRKLVLITGASSGLGLFCFEALLAKQNRTLNADQDWTKQDDYYVIAAVRDPAKMDAAAKKAGVASTEYAAVELQLASLQSVKDLTKDLKGSLGQRGLDRLVCNAAVYLPTDPKPRFTDDGFEMSLGVNHLGHFLLVQLLLPQLQRAKDSRCCIVGSVTGNKNTVAGSLVKPVADVGNLEGLANGAGEVMVDGAKKFDGAKAYKDAKALNMMTVLELHRRLGKKTGTTYNSMYPGCIANTDLFREKRDWFRFFFFPTLMKAIGSYVSQAEAGQRLAQVIDDPQTNTGGVYWSWNGNAKSIGVGNAGGSGGALFENEFSGMINDKRLAEMSYDYSMEAIKKFL